jgi:UrcA family protein
MRVVLPERRPAASPIQAPAAQVHPDLPHPTGSSLRRNLTFPESSSAAYLAGELFRLYQKGFKVSPLQRRKCASSKPARRSSGLPPFAEPNPAAVEGEELRRPTRHIQIRTAGGRSAPPQQLSAVPIKEPGRNDLVNKIAILTAAAVALMPVAASAETFPKEAKSMRVSHADLNLASPEGQKALHRRIGSAVEQVCGDEYGPDLRANGRTRACRTETLAAAMGKAEALRSSDPLRGTVTVTAMR